MRPRIRRLAWLGLMISSLLAAGCIPAVSTRLPPTDEFQTVTPVATISAFEDIPAVPEDHFLFIAVTGATRYGVFCDPPAIEALREPFAFYGDSLELWWSGFYGVEEQSWTDLRAQEGAMGLYAFYNLSSAKLVLFPELPFTTPDGDFVVTGFDAGGAVAVRLGDGLTRVESGKSIRQQVATSAGGMCRTMQTLTLTNFGFISDEQVTLR